VTEPNSFSFNLLSGAFVPRPEHIEEYKKLFEKQFNVRLSDDEARCQLSSLLVIVWYQQLEKRRKANNNFFGSTKDLTDVEKTIKTNDSVELVYERLKEMQQEISINDEEIPNKMT